MESFCLPGKSYPRWFVNVYRSLNDTNDDPPDTLRNHMAMLREKNKVMFDNLVSHIESYYDHWAVSPYTLAVQRIESMRKTADFELVSEKNEEAMSLFIEMSTFLMDIYIIADIYLGAFERHDHIVILTGANHTANISRFFTKYCVNTTVTMKQNEKGNIPSGKAESLAVVPGLYIPEKLKVLKDKAKHGR